MPASVEVVRLRQAIAAFNAQRPRDLPPEVGEKLKEVENALKDHSPDQASPGAREAAHVAGANPDATGESIRTAARGADKPSPGQRAVESARQSEPNNVSEAIERVAASVMEKVNGGRTGSDRGGAGDSRTR